MTRQEWVVTLRDLAATPMPEGNERIQDAASHGARSIEQVEALTAALTRAEQARDEFKAAWLAASDVGKKAVGDMASERIKRKAAELAHECSEGVLSMTVHRLEGTVDGAPTGRHNFLQRVDALRRIEAERDTLRAQLAAREQA